MIDYNVSEESFSGLDENVQGLYEKGESGYTLKVEGLPKGEDVSGLKRKVDELLNEKKSAQAKAAEAQAKAEQELQDKLAKEGKWEALYKSSEEARQKSAESLSALQGQIEKQTISQNAVEIASSLTKDTARAKLLSEKISERLALVDSELKVTDKSGNPTVSSVEELTNQLKTEYPFLIDGSQAAGGGATGASGRADDSKQVSRSDFESMPPHKRMEFIKSGGQIET